MSDDARIGRVLVASLHQAIADVLPDRLEFYENWLTVPGLREGTIGLAPLSAVLSFLRLEGEAYNRTTARAGEYAADWTVSSMSAIERRLICALPTSSAGARGAPHRARAGALDVSRDRASRSGSGAARPRSTCAARSSARVAEATAMPLCGFYAAAIARVLHHCSRSADAEVHECRAASRGKGCRLNVEVSRRERRRTGCGSMTRACRVCCSPLGRRAASLDRRAQVPALRGRTRSGACPRRSLRERAATSRGFTGSAKPPPCSSTDGLRTRGGPARSCGRSACARSSSCTCRFPGSLSRATIIKVGQLVGAADVIVGTYRVEGDDVVRTARSIRARRRPPAARGHRARRAHRALWHLRASRRPPGPSRAASAAAGAPPPTARRVRELHQGAARREPGPQASFLEAALRESPTFDRARLALWDVRDRPGGSRRRRSTTVRAVAGRPRRLALQAQFFAGDLAIELKRYDEASACSSRSANRRAGPPTAAAAVLNNLGVAQSCAAERRRRRARPPTT